MAKRAPPQRRLKPRNVAAAPNRDAMDATIEITATDAIAIRTGAAGAVLTATVPPAARAPATATSRAARDARETITTAVNRDAMSRAAIRHRGTANRAAISHCGTTSRAARTNRAKRPVPQPLRAMNRGVTESAVSARAVHGAAADAAVAAPIATARIVTPPRAMVAISPRKTPAWRSPATAAQIATTRPVNPMDRRWRKAARATVRR